MGAAASKSLSAAASDRTTRQLLSASSGDDMKAALATLPADVSQRLAIAAVESAGGNPALLERPVEGASCTFIFLLAEKIRKSTDEQFLTLQDIRRLRPDWLVRREVTFRDCCTGKLHRIMLALSHRWETPDHPDPSGKQLSVLKQRLRELPDVELVWIECEHGVEHRPVHVHVHRRSLPSSQS